jgi:hypothetical protein
MRPPIDGKGDPRGSPEYKEAIEALFSTASALKFAVEKLGRADYAMPDDRREWFWTTMIGRRKFGTDPVSWSYAAEDPAIAKLHLHSRERGHSISGKHLEIYLNAPDRTSPDKLKTIIQQPVR